MAEPPHGADLDPQNINYVVGTLGVLVTIGAGLFAWLRKKWSGEATDKAVTEAAFAKLREEIDTLRAKQETGDLMRVDMSHQLEALRRQVDQLPTRDDNREVVLMLTGMNGRIDRLFEKGRA